MDRERILGKEKREKGEGEAAVGCMAPVSHCATDGSLIAQPTSDPSTPSFHVVCHPSNPNPSLRNAWSARPFLVSPPCPPSLSSQSLSMPLHLTLSPSPFPPSTGIASIDRLSCECRNFWVDDQSGRRTDRFFIGIVHLRKFN